MLANQGARECVGRDLIDRGDDGVHLARVVDVPPLRAVSHEDANGVDHGERGAHEGGEIGDRGVDVLMEAIAPATENAVPIFHGGGELGQVVVLGHGYVDHLVGVDQGGEDRPLVEHIAFEAHGAKAMFRRKHDLGPHRIRLAPDAGALEAAIRVVA